MPEESDVDRVIEVAVFEEMTPLVDDIETAIADNFPNVVGSGRDHMMVCFSLADTLGRVLSLMLRENPETYYDHAFPLICDRIHKRAISTVAATGGGFRH